MEIKRVAAVTGGLIVVGAIAGALATAIAVAAVLLATVPRELVRDPGILLFAGTIGAAFGSVLGPLAAWLLMRHVPLGIAIGGTMLGTLAGGVAALLLDGQFPWNLYLALPLLGFFLAALVIRVSVPRPARVWAGG
jgi:hypothetical protein